MFGLALAHLGQGGAVGAAGEAAAEAQPLLPNDDELLAEHSYLFPLFTGMLDAALCSTHELEGSYRALAVRVESSEAGVEQLGRLTAARGRLLVEHHSALLHGRTEQRALCSTVAAQHSAAELRVLRLGSEMDTHASVLAQLRRDTVLLQGEVGLGGEGWGASGAAVRGRAAGAATVPGGRVALAARVVGGGGRAGSVGRLGWLRQWGASAPTPRGQ